MINFLSFNNIYLFIEKVLKFINSIFFIILLIGLTFSLIFSPPDYLQGNNVRIMYVHVPSAWIALATYSVIAFLSFINFIFNIKNIYLIKVLHLLV